MPIRKIVVSKWLQNLLKEESFEDSVLIPNGFDFKKFNLAIPIPKKDKFAISMLFHDMERKRSEDALAAIQLVKKKFPQLKVMAFGVPYRPSNFPEWIEYYQQPDDETHNRINNECAIYIGTSEQEGWGLTVGEAMICGQAVCCTDNPGYREMAIDGKTALLSPVRDPKSLSDNVIKLIENDELRQKIAEEGNRYIQSFTWEKSYEKFKKVLNLGKDNKVCFLFPHPAKGPTGGYKVVYEYANRLTEDGVEVHIVYSGSIFWKKKSLRFKLSNIYRYAETLVKGYSSRKWFPLDKRIKEHFTLSLNYRHVPKTDIYVATSPYTAWYLDSYPIK